VRSPWAILLCKFSDNASESVPRSRYDRLFTSAGSGSENVVDYFRDASHGRLDLSASRIFGWFTIDYTRDEYWRRAAEDLNGASFALVEDAKRAAGARGVPLGDYAAVVVSMNVRADLFGLPGAAVCDIHSLNVTLLGQEMGHGYGLAHSKHDRSEEEYKDPWDVMSATDAWSAVHPEFGNVGPLLNAWNMRSRGWLDEARVWRNDDLDGDHRVDLTSLARRDLSGWLAAEVPGGYLIEYRAKEGWDRQIPDPAVLVHTFDGTSSFLMPAASGRDDALQGDRFEFGSATAPSRPWVRIDVERIDATARRASLRVRYRAPRFDNVGVFYRGPGDWLTWRAYEGGRWHGEEVFNAQHPYATQMGAGPFVVGGTEAAPVVLPDWAGHRFAVFFRGPDERLRWKAHAGGRWHSDAILEGSRSLTSDPAVARGDRDDVGLFYRTADDWLAWREYSQGRWHGEERFDGGHQYATRIHSAPAAVANWRGHRFAVFFKGRDGRLWWKAHHSGRWHSEAPLAEGGSELTSPPVVVREGITGLAVFYRTSGDWLAWRAYAGGRWHGEERFDENHPYCTRMQSGPSVVTSWTGHRFAVFFRGDGDTLHWKAHHGGRWHHHAAIAGGRALTSRPAVVGTS
jgi:hypothetical protein